MRYIDSFREGMHISDVYLCKNRQIALTKNGKEYGNLVLQDKTGTIDAKIWDPLYIQLVGAHEHGHIRINVYIIWGWRAAPRSAARAFWCCRNYA